jgi:hypothetical protein
VRIYLPHKNRDALPDGVLVSDPRRNGNWGGDDY